MNENIITRFHQMATCGKISTPHFEAVLIDNLVIIRKTAKAAKGGVIVTRVATIVFSIVIPSTLYLIGDHYARMMLMVILPISIGLVVNLLVVWNRPIKQVPYIELDPAQYQIYCNTRSSQQSQRQTIDISKIKRFYLSNPPHLDDAGSLYAEIDGNDCKLFDGCNYNRNITETIGRWLSLLCDKPFLPNS